MSSIQLFILSNPILEKIFGILSTIWTIFGFLAYTVSILLLVLYVYASSEKRQLVNLKLEALKKREMLYLEQFRGGVSDSRLKGVDEYINSDNPRDWKLAIIEADVILDEALKSFGYQGVSVGERLKDTAPAKLLSINDAWQAHKIRNQIAHSDADFILTKKIAEDTIKQYRRVFTELGVF